MNNLNADLWLIGTGLMAKEYARVLNQLGVKFLAIGRGDESARAFEEEFNVTVERGGLQAFLNHTPKLPKKVIVTVGIEALAETTELLLDFGVVDILLEKPGIGYPREINR